jgi:hypothetical protein
MDLQGQFDTLNKLVSNLETTEVKQRDTIGSLRQQLLQTNETYVKDKDRLSKAQDDATDRHRSASVGHIMLTWTHRLSMSCR